MEQTNLLMWPILYFQADWPAETPPFDFDVRLIKASEEILAIVRNVESPAWGCNNKAMCDFGGNTEWFLSLPSREPTEHVSYSEIGISFEDRLQETIVDSFLMCLRLIRQTAAICPLIINNVELVGECIDPDSFRNALDESDFFGINTDKPQVFMPEPFQLGDLQLLTDLWSAIIKLRKLDYWSKQVFTELFFQQLSDKAGKNAKEKLLKLFLSKFSKEEQKIYKEKFASMIKQMQAKGEMKGLWQEFWADCFREAFAETQEDRTRIGRALSLFYESIGLPILHGFLSMCLVLETLFTIGEGEISHKLAVRVTNIVGKKLNLDERKDIYKRTKKVYTARSDIVHGEKLIDVVDPEVLKDAFTLARRSLQSILLSEELLKLYSNPGTTDRRLKKGMKKDAYDSIRDFFLNLDLRGEIESDT